MPHSSWRESTAVVNALANDPSQFTLLQAVRVIEAAIMATPDNASKRAINHGVGLYTQPNNECVRFYNSHALSFSGSDIYSVKPPETSLMQWQCVTRFLGLTGSHGVMPFSFTQTVLERLKQKDPSISAFLDVFHHRTLSLYYRASVKYSLPLNFENTHHTQRKAKQASDPASAVLRAVSGLGTKGLDDQLSIPPQSLLFYAGLFSQKVRNVTGLKQLLSDYMQVPIKIDEFVGRWEDIIDDVRTKLPSAQSPLGQNVCLGQSAMLGKKGWVAQGKIQIIIGPLNAKQYLQFAPSGTALKAVNELARFYLGFDHDYDITVLVDKKDTPHSVTLSSKTKPILGWNMWLSSGADPDSNPSSGYKSGLGHKSTKDNTIAISLSGQPITHL